MRSMTEEDSALALPPPREIRAKLDEHDERFDNVHVELARLHQRLCVMSASIRAALGIAAHSNIRHVTSNAEMEALRARVTRLEALEEKV